MSCFGAAADKQGQALATSDRHGRGDARATPSETAESATSGRPAAANGHDINGGDSSRHSPRRGANGREVDDGARRRGRRYGCS